MAFVVDQMIQAQDDPGLVWNAVDELQKTAEEAASQDRKYEQLVTLVTQFTSGLKDGSDQVPIQLVNVEMECEQLGYSP